VNAAPAVEAVRQATLAVSAPGTARAVVFGLIVVAVLLLGFWWGARRRAKDRRAVPRRRQRRADSWHEPQRNETHHSAHSHDDDHD
jgi:hypothetical protein